MKTGTIIVRQRLHHRPCPQTYTEAEIRLFSRICAIYESIDRVSPIRQSVLVRFFVPLLDSLTNFDWRQLAANLYTGKTQPEEGSFIELLYGVDFYTLRQFLDQEDPDHQLLNSIWDQLVVA